MNIETLAYVRGLIHKRESELRDSLKMFKDNAQVTSVINQEITEVEKSTKLINQIMGYEYATNLNPDYRRKVKEIYETKGKIEAAKFHSNSKFISLEEAKKEIDEYWNS